FQIRIFPIEYYIASKFEAFKSRGAGSLLSSHDLEDIIYVFDGNEDIDVLLRNSDIEVRSYLQTEIARLLSNPNISEIVTGHLGYGAFYERAERIIEIFRRLSAML
ncbi:MAG: hypothetical protein K8I03_14750, partial [Ignavibacteria bacterium]|nr:hypothetical protein [Ignavibacteria bacterium]